MAPSQRRGNVWQRLKKNIASPGIYESQKKEAQRKRQALHNPTPRVTWTRNNKNNIPRASRESCPQTYGVVRRLHAATAKQLSLLTLFSKEMIEIKRPATSQVAHHHSPSTATSSAANANILAPDQHLSPSGISHIQLRNGVKF
ncbi:hypothetical protein V493_04706 [Pseudogymnoascus sp. VKM F-4281 (FW-2241)]|nr:hypothetical protein V493_04706 [Pseudogymnoascus sp. VKM F-4281 (FW-2241)]